MWFNIHGLAISLVLDYFSYTFGTHANPIK